MRALAALVGVFLLSGLVGAFQDSVKTEKMSLLGTWTLKDVQLESEEDTKRIAKKAKGTKLIFSATKVTMKSEGKEQSGSYRIDTTKTPKEMDWSVKTPDGKEIVMRGIYEQKGDHLTICFGGVNKKDKGDGGSKRPTTLKPTGAD